MGNVLVHVDVQNQSGTVALDGVTVRVYEADGTTFVAEEVTGSSAPGQVEFTLFGDNPGVDYIVRFSRNGWHFPAGPSQLITVDDPPVDNDFGPYDALQGPSAALVTLAVSYSPAAPDQLEGVQAFVYNSSDVFVTEVATDDQGEAKLPLTGSSLGTTYIVRLKKPGVVFEEPTQTILVLNPVPPGGSNIFDFVGHVVAFPESTDPDLCMIYGYFADVSLLPARKVRLEFKPCPRFEEAGCVVGHGAGRFLGGFTSEPTLVRDRLLARSVEVDTDKTGFFQVELPRKGLFEVHIHGLEEPFEITERIYVPDAANAQFFDLLYPYVQSVAYDPEPIDVAVGETAMVDLTVVFSNQETIVAQDIIQTLIEFTVADPTIASVSLASGTQLAVQGLQAGSTTIVATRRAGYVVPSRPPVDALAVTPPVVNVS